MDLPPLPPAGLTATPRAPANASRAAAENFEGQVLGVMLQEMFAGLGSKGPLSGGQAEAQWRPLLVQEFGSAIARAGGLGIADSVMRQLRGQGG
ncbi:rod-binding protein [Falsiroseomonas selenitidurans]|uniref:Chemotaxis protein chel n=1 Tax=Falsiroseomonas selenitidurans TaxID=2716335 RepID=A0ABX1E3D8_9PROT|nr:rod-binding protein [Falsiroseomonas selenitidurans]NKC31696.1 chemotaxis protein chel [Falsiroseomonas selenitidurans]